MQFFKITIAIFLLIPSGLNQAVAQNTGTDLPVVTTMPKFDNSDKMVVFISGDGGWDSFSQQLVETYAAQGMGVVGLNSLKYFWKKKSPQQAANDIASLMIKYSNEWQKKKIVLCGYSFGADVTPFIYRRLPDHLKDKITLLQLLSPSSFTDFEIHISDLFGLNDPVRSMGITSELKMIEAPVLCYYGILEKEKPLEKQQKTGFKVIILPGDHHYKNSFMEIAKAAGQ